MSSPTTAGIQIPRTGLRRLLIAATLVLAMAAGGVVAFLLTSTAPAADGAPTTVTVEGSRAGAGSCTASRATAGGLVEGLSTSDACGAPGGTAVSGGLQP